MVSPENIRTRNTIQTEHFVLIYLSVCVCVFKTTINNNNNNKVHEFVKEQGVVYEKAWVGN